MQYHPKSYETLEERVVQKRDRAMAWASLFSILCFLTVVCSLLSALDAIIAADVQKTRWIIATLVGVTTILAVIGLATLRSAFRDLDGWYRGMLADYTEAFTENMQRAKFMINFTPSRELVSETLRLAAYRVLRVHQQIAELHEKGLPDLEWGSEPDNPETRLQELRRDFTAMLQGLENAMKDELSRFRELRDVAAWAGADRFAVRKSWWDYIDPKDLPKESKRKDAQRMRTGEGDEDLHPDDPRSSTLVEGANEQPGQ